MNQIAMPFSFVQTRARRTDCDTSKAAAKAAVTRKADGERIRIKQVMRFYPRGLTARDVSQITGIDYIEVQRRISECGLTKTDQRRDGCAVWVAV